MACFRWNNYIFGSSHSGRRCSERISDFKNSAFRTVDLVLPSPRRQTSVAEREQGNIELLQPWLLALRQCSKTTLRKLTFVGHGQQDDFFLGSDKQYDTRVTVSSLVGSGLPIPRSPSGQFPDSYQEKDGILSGEERQERGWWSLRYQQVFREFRRQDSLLLMMMTTQLFVLTSNLKYLFVTILLQFDLFHHRHLDLGVSCIEPRRRHLHSLDQLW
ncbi:hypothetical protein CPB84DRAFT_1202903 [Gymnopilus junonius]|uniref:Uncharacterized protein n=1 Tax=Gymnopilus junonius TaxID=109634 RepID=A0A9P5TMF6_GYMJU|nr:hypothetical protein CPB84DRAFT_1202903 [Gymnopilus junonius]